MTFSIAELTPYVGFAVPPLIGALIGYLTNRVAIRMLFRPLTQWRVGPIKIPMTPGVIPSKRHDLAVNIGDMVGEHLLTSAEINRSLQKSRFQEHLYCLIEAKVGALLKRDFGPLVSLIPQNYKAYFDIASKTVIYQIKDTVHTYLQSGESARIIGHAINEHKFELLIFGVCKCPLMNVNAITSSCFAPSCIHI